jgi:hypothetical protein
LASSARARTLGASAEERGRRRSWRRLVVLVVVIVFVESLRTDFCSHLLSPHPFKTTTIQTTTSFSSSRRSMAAAAPVARRVRAVAVRAAPQEEPRMEESGYVNSDSAGQSNMYPVITRAYEAKATDIGLGNVAVLLGAAAAAGAAIFFGLNGVQSTAGTPPEVAELKQYQTLSEYASKFSAEV